MNIISSCEVSSSFNLLENGSHSTIEHITVKMTKSIDMIVLLMWHQSHFRQVLIQTVGPTLLSQYLRIYHKRERWEGVAYIEQFGS